MASKSLYLSSLIGADNKVAAESLSADIPLGTEDYTTANDLPATGNQVGDQAFVASTQRLYIWTGAGWYNIALINQTPTWDSGGLPEAAYELDSIGGTATTIQLSATDPDGLPIQWTYSITDSGNDLATITNDSNGTFTITAKSLNDILNSGYDSEGGVFDITFRASDGVNLATALSEFTISFAAFGQPFQGSNYGYSSGGFPNSSSATAIQKFSFSTDGNASQIGSLTVGRYAMAGQSSSEYGYNSGGGVGPSNVIDKFPFAIDGNATDIGDLSQSRARPAGQSSSEYGYSSGGSPNPSAGNIIDKFPFATDANATDVGDITVGRYSAAGQSSTEYGYTSGGSAPQLSNFIDKFPFASDGNATDVGDLSVERNSSPAGQNSADYGYTSGGIAPSYYNIIDKFPFASDGNATDVGDLTVERYGLAGQSSTDYGYSSGGYIGPAISNNIDKFSFATDGNATSVGSLAIARFYSTGQQY